MQSGEGSSTLPEIELHQAWTWDCDNCGTGNYCRAVTAELTPEEKEEMLREEYGIQPYDAVPEALNVEMITCPVQVTCSSCGAEFKTKEHGPHEA